MPEIDFLSFGPSTLKEVCSTFISCLFSISTMNKKKTSILMHHLPWQFMGCEEEDGYLFGAATHRIQHYRIAKVFIILVTAMTVPY